MTDPNWAAKMGANASSSGTISSNSEAAHWQRANDPNIAFYRPEFGSTEPVLYNSTTNAGGHAGGNISRRGAAFAVIVILSPLWLILLASLTGGPAPRPIDRQKLHREEVAQARDLAPFLDRYFHIGRIGQSGDALHDLGDVSTHYGLAANYEAMLDDLRRIKLSACANLDCSIAELPDDRLRIATLQSAGALARLATRIDANLWSYFIVRRTEVLSGIWPRVKGLKRQSMEIAGVSAK